MSDFFFTFVFQQRICILLLLLINMHRLMICQGKGAMGPEAGRVQAVRMLDAQAVGLITCSFLFRTLVWQASPRAAWKAWETTWRMQASGVCCPWAASISSSRALHTEAETSSGSTNRNTLGGRNGRELLDGRSKTFIAPSPRLYKRL